MGSTVTATVTDAQGRYSLATPARGRAELSFSLVNFATVRRPVDLTTAPVAVDAVMHLALSADVTVTGKSTFTNLADASDPSQNLIGIARSASQGAITARQIELRPIMRPGEVLEAVPGLVISQHSGEGKANQYYLRGFNLDHGTDFATTVAGMPVNMPTHGTRPRLFRSQLPDPRADERRAVLERPVLRRPRGLRHRRCRDRQSDATRSSRPIARGGGGDQASAARSSRRRRRVGNGHLLGALEVQNERRTVGPARRPAENQRRRCATAAATRSTVWSVTGMGVSRPLERDRPDPRPRGRRRADRPVRADRRQRRRRIVALQRLLRMAAHQRQSLDGGRGLRHQATRSTCSRTSPISSTTPSTATSSSRPIAASSPARG